MPRKHQLFVFSLILLIFSSTEGVNIPWTNNGQDSTIELEQPTYFLQKAYSDSISFDVGQVEVPLGYGEGAETPDLHHLAEGYVCPGSDMCFSGGSSSACSCNFTLSDCSSLPSCCATTYPNVWQQTCATTPPDWRLLTPNQLLEGIAYEMSSTDGPVQYFRYHPSPESLCKGFAFDVTPPRSGALEPPIFGVIVYASLDTIQPELNTTSWKITYTPTGVYEMAQNVILCPASTYSRTYDPTDAFTNFFGPYNDRTVFITVVSVAAGTNRAVIFPSRFQIQILETNDVRDQSLVSESSLPVCFSSLPCLADGQSAYAVGALGSLHTFYYQHPTTAAECSPVTINVRTLSSSCEVNLYVAYANQTLAPYFYNTTWMSRKIGPDSVVFYICPEDSITFAAHIYLGSGPFIMSLSTTAPSLARSLANDISSLWLSSYLVGASRLLCSNATTASRFPLGNGFGDWRCTSWYGQWFENCRQYWPLGPSQDVNPLWPTPPPPFGLITVDTSRDPAQLPVNLTYTGGNSFWASIVLDRNLINADGSQTPLVYWRDDQLPSCHIQFLNKLFDPVNLKLLTGSTNSLVPRQNICSSSRLRAVRRELSAALVDLAAASPSQVNTQLLRLSLLNLEQASSNCTQLLNEYSNPTVLVVGNASAVSASCSSSDPCCSSAPSEVTSLYDYCLEKSYVLLNTLVPETDLIDQGCDLVECTTDLINEAGSAYQYLAGEPSDKCAYDAQTALTFSSTLSKYFLGCRSRYTGPFGTGLECQTTADCPGNGTGRVICSAFHRFASSSQRDQFATKRCLADSALWDELIFECLVNEVPALLDEPLRASLNLPKNVPFTDPSVRSQLWDAFTSAGCGSAEPNDLLAYRSYFNLINTDGNSCVPRDGCPLNLTCVDSSCTLPHMCITPWRSCTYSWTLSTDTVPTEDTCATENFRCNVVSSSGPVTCSSAEDCAVQCGIDLQPQFCGYCDADTQRCYEISGIQSEAECDAIKNSGCFYRGTEQLTTDAQCTTLGTCDILTSATDSYSPISSDECLSRNICTYSRGTRPIRGGYCQNGVSALWPACTAKVTTASGCAELDPATGTPLKTKDQCTGSLITYPLRNVTWLDSVLTRADCLEQDIVKVCFIPGATTPNLNNESVCTQRGGVLRSPYTFREANFTAAQQVGLAWMNRTYLPTTVYLSNGTLDFIKIASLWSDVLARISVIDAVSRSVCRFFSPASTAITALSCQCNASEITVITDDSTSACRNLPIPSSNNLPPPTLSSVSQFCAGVAATINAPPALLKLGADFSFQPSSKQCVSANISYYSAGRFVAPRTRVRGTSFFVSRQDEHIPSLAVLNQDQAPVGLVLSDGVYVTTSGGKNLYNISLCIEPRHDFVERILLLQNTSRRQLAFRFAFGIASPDFRQVNPILLSRPPRLVFYVQPSENATDTAFDILPYLRYVCYDFTHFQTSDSIYFAITVNEDPEQSNNGFSTSEDNWMIGTGASYLVPPGLFFFPILVILVINHLRNKKDLTITSASGTFLAIFFVLRGALLLCLATGTVASNSTTEFALSEFAILFEFCSVSLIAIYFFNLLSHLKAFRKITAWHKPSIVTTALINLFLLCLLIAFLIAFSQSPADDGISNTLVSCLGRVSDGQSFWTTRRILRFTYSAIIAVFTLLLGISLIELSRRLYQNNSKGHTALTVFTTASVFAALSLLSHTILAMVLLGTGYNDFAFEIAMLWITEIIPLTVFLLCINATAMMRVYRSVSTSQNTASRTSRTRAPQSSHLSH